MFGRILARLLEIIDPVGAQRTSPTGTSNRRPAHTRGDWSCSAASLNGG